MGKTFDFVVIVLIFLVCTMFVLKTYNLPERVARVLDWAEAVITVIFIIEYLLRFFFS